MEIITSTLVAQAAPDFKTKAVMPDGLFADLSLADYKGKYVLLFFYPLDFTFVCPTEIIAFSEANAEFAALDTQILGCSVDSAYAHFAWRNTPRNEGGIGPIAYPLLSDITKDISIDYGVYLPEAGVALRGLFLIDREGVVQHQVVNNLPLGRSVAEALRMVRALQFHEKNGEVCPANWDAGKTGMKPNAQGVKDYLSHEH